MNVIAKRLSPRDTRFMLLWLATHRDRLRSLVLGTSHFTVVLIHDRDGDKTVDRSPVELDAMFTLMNGYPPSGPVEGVRSE